MWVADCYSFNPTRGINPKWSGTWSALPPPPRGQPALRRCLGMGGKGAWADHTLLVHFLGVLLEGYAERQELAQAEATLELIAIIPTWPRA